MIRYMQYLQVYNIGGATKLLFKKCGVAVWNWHIHDVKYQFKIKPYGDYRPGSLAQNQLMVSRYGVKKSLYSIYTCHICTCSSLMLVSQIQYSDSCVP